MKIGLATISLSAFLVAGCATAPESWVRPDLPTLRREVMETERAFARTMADRDHAAFVSFLSEETVFFSGPKPLRGKKEVADWWKRYYEKPAPPFSWEPEEVELLPSGTLALSSGPVRDQDGAVAGTFISIWRLEARGVWRIVFDKGCKSGG
jgi:ketosteroid isomerase-like protein